MSEPVLESHLQREKSLEQLAAQLQAERSGGEDATSEPAPTTEAGAPTEPAPVETPAVEPPTEPAPAPRVDPTADPQYLRLLQEQREARQAMERERQAREEAERNARRLEDDLRANPAQIAKKYGLTLEEMTALELGEDTGAAANRQVQTRLEKLEQELAQARQEKEALAKKQEQEAQARMVEDFKANMRREVDSDPSLKLVGLAGLHDKVYSAIEQDALQQTQLYGAVHKFLDSREAARRVLAAEVPNLKKMVEGLREFDEFREIFGSPAAPQTPAAPAQQPSGPTSLMASQLSAAGGPSREERPLTREERRAAAVALLKQRGYGA